MPPVIWHNLDGQASLTHMTPGTGRALGLYMSKNGAMPTIILGNLDTPAD